METEKTPFSSLGDEGKYYQEILSRIRYRNDWEIILNLDGNRYYVCFEWNDVCNFTGKTIVSRSAKYYLSPHMTQTEVVNRVFLAALKASEHELREQFRYRPSDDVEWRAPYNTHIDIDCLYYIAKNFDVRK